MSWVGVKPVDIVFPAIHVWTPWHGFGDAGISTALENRAIEAMAAPTLYKSSKAYTHGYHIQRLFLVGSVTKLDPGEKPI